MLYITTSWDDGDALDTKLAELLTRYGAKGTFYVTQQYRENRLSDEQIRAISKNHEIGAHTLTHPNLTAIFQEKAFEEIQGSKQWLEKITGAEVPLFCYPSGFYNEEIVSLVKKAGYRGARTTAHSHTELPASAYEMPTTMHLYPFPFRKKISGGPHWRFLFEPLKQRYMLYRELGVPRSALTSWLSVAKAAFDRAYDDGEVFHLWGHSWEVEGYGMWQDLEALLQHMTSRRDVRFVTNGELLAAANAK